MVHRAWRALVWAAFAWAVGNCLYVYFLAGGARVYRVEASALILVAVLLPAFFLPASVTPRASWPRVHTVVLLTLAAALWLAAVAPRLAFPFLSDDYVFLDRYRTAADAFTSPYFFRPLFASLFWLARTIGHDSPVPFHILSLGLHAASAACVYLLARRILESSTGATLAAVIFLVNPLQLEVTLWPSGLQDGLWTLCILAAAVIYTWRRELSVGRLLLTALFVALGLLSKETAVCVILVLPLTDVVLGFDRGRLRFAAYGVFAAELAAYLWLRAHFAVTVDHQLAVTPTRYFFKQFVTTPYRVFTLPWNASAVDVPLALQCAVVVAALSIYLVACRRPAMKLLIGPALIVASTAPLAGYFFVGPDLAAARYVYFAAAGWGMLVAECFDRCFRNPRIRFAVAIVLVAALSSALLLNLRPWRAAAELVRGLDDGMRRGQAASEVVQDWQKRHQAVAPLNSEGVPDSYQGVYVFANGYPEYVRLKSRRAP